MIKMVLFPSIPESDVINQAVDEVVLTGSTFDYPTDSCEGGLSARSLSLLLPPKSQWAFASSRT